MKIRLKCREDSTAIYLRKIRKAFRPLHYIHIGILFIYIIKR